MKLFDVISTLAFGEAYAERSGVTLRWLIDAGQVPFICHCGEQGCDGFAMMTKLTARHYVRRGQMEDPCEWLGVTRLVFDTNVGRSRCADCGRVVASGQGSCVCGAVLGRGAAVARSSVTASN